MTGAVPTSLSGKYVWISDGMIHTVGLGAGRAPSYRNRPTTTPATTVIWFGGSLLAFGDGQLALELESGAPIDLAGARRALAAQPTLDPVTGELHLLTFETDPGQLHVRVSPGGLTRTVRSIDGAPGRIRQLALTREPRRAPRRRIRRTDRTDRLRRPSYLVPDRHLGAPIRDRARRRRDRRRVRHGTVPRAMDTAPPGEDCPLRGARREPAHLCEPARVRHRSGARQYRGRRRLAGLVRDGTTDGINLAVLDAHAIDRPALAAAAPPRGVPDGAGGTWVPGVPQI